MSDPIDPRPDPGEGGHRPDLVGDSHDPGAPRPAGSDLTRPVDGPGGPDPADPGGSLADPYHQLRELADEPAAPVDVSGEHVTAVLVCHDSASWLPSTLASLTRLDPAPDRLVVVTNTPGDAAGPVLAEAVAAGTIDLLVDGEPGFGFADAVSAALRADEGTALPDAPMAAPDLPERVDALGDPATTGPDGAATGRRHWLWLLHDDLTATPDVLGRLLQHVAADDQVAVTGPTLLVPARGGAPRRLWQSTVSVSGTGRSVALAEPDEVAQGQLDRPERVLGLSTCGLLVRRDVYDELGGLAPETPVFLDGVELGWRATRAGHRVVTTPAALLMHRRVGRAGLRASSATGEHPAAVERALAMSLVAAHRHGVPAVLTGVRMVWGCLLRMLGFVLGKTPDRSAEEWRALRAYLSDGPRRRALRARIDQSPSTEAGRAAAASLRPPWWHSLRVGAEWCAGALADRFRALTGRPDTSLDELTGDDFAGHEDAGPPWWRTALLLAVGLVAVGGVFGRWVVPGLLTSTQLLPGASTLATTWARYLTPPGEAPAPPWLGLLAVLATPLGGRTDWVLVLLVAGGTALALLAGYAALRAVDVAGPAAWWGAGVWALLPTVLGAQQRGSLLAVVWAVALPLLVVALTRLLRRTGLQATRGTFGVALALTVLAALAPLVLAPAVLGAGLLIWRRRDLAVRAGIAVGVPVLLLAPWAPTLLTWPGRWLTGPDPALVDPAAPTGWRLLLGQTPGAAWFDGAPVPLLVGAVAAGVIWLLGLLALVRRGGDPVVRAGWVVALVGFGVALALGTRVVAVPPFGDPARPEVTGWLLLAFGALLTAGARGVGAASLPGGLRRVVSVVVAVTVLAVGTAWWAFDGVTGPATRRAADLPPFIVTAMAETPVRTLAVDLTSGEPTWNLLSDDGPRTGDAELGAGLDRAERDEVGALVARLVTTGGDAALSARLAELGVGYLWVRGADPAALTAIGSTPDLQEGSSNEGTQVWSLTLTPTAPTEPTVAPATAVVAVLQLVGLLVVLVMAAPALSREDEDEPVARRGREAGPR